MKKFLLAASAAVAVFAMAPMASATTTYNVYNPSDANGITLTPTDLSDGFSSSTLQPGLFEDTFNFFVPVDGWASANASVISSFGNRFSDFAGALYLVGGINPLATFTIEPFGPSGIAGFLDPVFLEGGKDYKLVFSGNVLEEIGYGGDLTITPVPEPTTWAMMIVGLAAVGFTMRRSQTTRVAFS